LGRALPVGQVAPSVAPAVLGLSGFDVDGLAPRTALHALALLASSTEEASRGILEEKLYKRASPAVVIVLTKDGFGSGSVLSRDGRILTNWHVVSGYSEVGVIYKPKIEGASISDASVVVARVLATDKTADLALLEAAVVPSSAGVLPLGDPTDVEIGADVSAIGHPTGEAWTYTRGIISQVRLAYQWKEMDGSEHTADVIQTQTPINPGNSGGPLLTDTGRVIGVNAFKLEGAEGLNYAISITEIRKFLASQTQSSTTSQKSSECEPKVVYKGRSQQNDGDLTTFDIDCSGRARLAFFAPDDPSKPYEAWIDRNGTGKIDMIVYADGRTFKKWKYSLIDSSDSGKFDVMGIHSDGTLNPTSYVAYKP